MRLPALTDRDNDVIEAALRATIEGPFFPDWEFGTLIGFYRAEVRRVLDHWPDGMGTEPTDSIVHAVLAQLTGYPHNEWEAWAAYSDASEVELKAVQRHYGDRPRES